MNSYGNQPFGIWEALGTEEPTILWVYGKYCNVCGHRHQWSSESQSWCSSRFSEFRRCTYCSSRALKSQRVYRITDEQKNSRRSAAETRLITVLKLTRRRYNDDREA